jgi:carnitine 3-dehydrogenase
MQKKGTIQKIACVGAGIIGHSWAILFAMKGHPVFIQDSNKASIKTALRRIKVALNLCAEKNLIEEQTALEAYNRVNIKSSIARVVADADYVVESTLENYQVKKKIFKEMDQAAPEEAILASSSSGLLMSIIQKVTEKPERCIVAHPFNPPHLIPLVEIVPGERTSETTIRRTALFMKSLGKVPIVVRKEVSGYLANRLQRGIMQQAEDIVKSGIATVEDVDRALSTGPGVRWAIYGKYLQDYFNTPSHLMRNKHMSGLVAKGYEEYGLLRGKSFDEMVRWRDSKLIDVLRVLGHLPLGDKKDQS